MALGMAYGPEAGLELLDQLAGLPALQGYHLLPSVRGDLLAKLGRHDEAKAEFARAANDDPKRTLNARCSWIARASRHSQIAIAIRAAP